MLFVFDRASRDLVPARDLPEAGWMHVVDPTPDETQLLRAHHIPDAFIAHALDIDEVARVDRQDYATLIIVRVPRKRLEDTDLPYRSVGLGVVLLDRLVVTISRTETEIAGGICTLDSLASDDSLKFLLQLVMYVAERFLAHVRAIDAIVSDLEAKLKASLANQEVMELLKYQKGLVHFTTALESNRIMLERLGKGSHLQMDAVHSELLEDVLVEVQQAIEMAKVSADILSQMMDAFASIISNNLNVVMKVLTSVTIVLTGPMLVASLYGMNVALPGQTHSLAFELILVASLVIAVAVTVFFWRRRWL
jgi:magnesium transporter